MRLKLLSSVVLVKKMNKLFAAWKCMPWTSPTKLKECQILQHVSNHLIFEVICEVPFPGVMRLPKAITFHLKDVV